MLPLIRYAAQRRMSVMMRRQHALPRHAMPAYAMFLSAPFIRRYHLRDAAITYAADACAADVAMMAIRVARRRYAPCYVDVQRDMLRVTL